MNCPGCGSGHAQYAGTCGGARLVTCNLCGWFGSQTHNLVDINPMVKPRQELPEVVVTDAVRELEQVKDSDNEATHL